jgi:hypothetical protein
MRVQITLTGERAEEYLTRKELIDEELGYETTHPEAIGLLMNSAVADEMLSSSSSR